MKLSEALRDDPRRLASARAAAGLTVAGLARRAGVSRAAVRKWEARGVPAGRVGTVAAALGDVPAAAAGPLEQLGALARTEPGLTEARFRARAGRLAGHLEQAELAGVLHRAHAAEADAAGRRYDRVRVLSGPGPALADDRPRLSGSDVTALRHLRGWSQRELAAEMHVTRQRVTDLERHGVPDGRQEELRRLLVDPLSGPDVIAARKRVGLSQAELSRRLGYKQHAQVNEWERGRRTLTLSAAVRIGHVLAAAASEDPVEDACRRVVEVVAAAGPEGCTRSDLRLGLSLGRRPGATGVRALDAAGLERAERQRRVHWRDDWTQRRGGDWMRSRRLHVGPPPRAAAGRVMSGNELRQAREAAGVSLSEAAADLDTVWSAVWKLERRGSPPGSRTVPPHVAERAPELFRRRAAARPDPIEQARTRLRTAAAAEPGLPGWRLLQVAGYGKSNPTAQAVLVQLVDAGELHLRVTPMRAPHSGSRLAVHPGPAPAGLEQPTPLPGAELLRRRDAAGLRQRDLAAALGVTQTVVSRWERTAVPPLRAAAVARAVEDLGRELPEPLSGEQLRDARKAAGLSQAALGERLGVHQVSVNAWERRGVPRGRVDAVRRVLSTTD